MKYYKGLKLNTGFKGGTYHLLFLVGNYQLGFELRSFNLWWTHISTYNMHVYLTFKDLNYEGKPAKVETTNAITKRTSRFICEENCNFLPKLFSFLLSEKGACFYSKSWRGFWLFQTLLQGTQTCWLIGSIPIYYTRSQKALALFCGHACKYKHCYWFSN